MPAGRLRRWIRSSTLSPWGRAARLAGGRRGNGDERDDGADPGVVACDIRGRPARRPGAATWRSPTLVGEALAYGPGSRAEPGGTRQARPLVRLIEVAPEAGPRSARRIDNGNDRDCGHSQPAHRDPDLRRSATARVA